MIRTSIVVFAVALLAACNSQQGADSDDASAGLVNSSASQPPNILFILADDLGLDSLSVFGEHPRNAVTPNLDALAARGMRFTQFWAQPTCSPTRVTALTGRYAFRHDVISPLWDQSAHLGVAMPEPPPGSPAEYAHDPLGPVPPGGRNSNFNTSDPEPGQAPQGPRSDELLLPAALQQLPTPYSTAAFGKWHMADRDNGWLNHPNDVGFDYFKGPLAGALPSFFAWQQVENGEPSQQFGYVDQHSVDGAVSWLSQQSADQPWFMWFSFVNPHVPFHKPPAELIHSDDLKALDPQGINAQNHVSYFLAQVEAMDSLVGQLLAGIPEEQRANTYIFWLGDNGDESWGRAAEEQLPNRYKRTVYQGGIHVPAIVSGPGISENSINDSMAHVVDLFATAIELAGGNLATATAGREIDSQSFAAQLMSSDNARQREWNFSEGNMRNLGGYTTAIRNAEYKLISSPMGDQLYRLSADPGESENLTESSVALDQQNYSELRAQLDALLSE